MAHESIKLFDLNGAKDLAQRYPASKSNLYALACQENGAAGGKLYIGPMSYKEREELIAQGSGNCSFDAFEMGTEHYIQFPAQVPVNPQHPKNHEVKIDGQEGTFMVSIAVRRAGVALDRFLKGEPIPANTKTHAPIVAVDPAPAEESAMDRLKAAATIGARKAAAQQAAAEKEAAEKEMSVVDRLKAKQAKKAAAEKAAAEKAAAEAQQAARLLAEQAQAQANDSLLAAGIPAECPADVSSYPVTLLHGEKGMEQAFATAVNSVKEGDNEVLSSLYQRGSLEVKKGLLRYFGKLDAAPAVKPEAERPAVPSIVNRVTPPAVAPPAPTPARNNGLAGASPRHLPNPVAVKEEEVTEVTAATTPASPGHLSGVHFPCKAWQVRVFNVNPTTKSVTSFDEECSTFAEAQKFANMATRCGAAYTCILPLL